MILSEKQLKVKEKIELMAVLFGIDPKWATAIAMAESSLGINQKSPTGCRGVFQMSMVAMKDLWQLMSESDDELVDISCGVAFLRLLKKRWGTIEATNHYCNPDDKGFYLKQVQAYMEEL
jgi:hypothetical protein